MTIILKTTSKGQITLPVKWRKKFNTNQYIATQKDNKLELEPLVLKKKKDIKEYTVVDAIRDNKGKGIKAKDLASILEKTI